VPKLQKFDVKGGKGTKGETSTFTNLPLRKFKCVFLTWTSSQHAAWQVILDLLEINPATGQSKNVSVYHPACAESGLVSVVATEIGSLFHEGKRLFSREIDFLEYNPPGPTSIVSTPTGTTTTDPTQSPGTQQPASIVAAQQQRDALITQLAGLPKS